MVDNINFMLDVGQGRSQAIVSYNQVVNYPEEENQDDETLYKLRAITDHPNYNGSLYNIMVEWETGEHGSLAMHTWKPPQKKNYT